VLHERDAVVYLVGLERGEVETAAGLGGEVLAGEVDQLGEGAADLHRDTMLSAFARSGLRRNGEER
jgi:hypothetical protein